LQIFLPFLASALITLKLIPIIINKSNKLNLFVGHKKLVKKKLKTIRLGGIAISIGVLLTFSISLIFLKDQDQIFNLISILLGALSFFILGIIDDFLELGAIQRLLIECLIAFLLVHYNFEINGLMISPNKNLFFIEMPHVLNYILPILWIVGFTNAINWIDGIDGLAGGVTIILSTHLALISFGLQNYPLTILLSCLIGSCISFLVFNKYPSKIIMGDGGSHFIGFLISTLSMLIFSDTNQLNSSNNQNILYLTTEMIVIFLPILEMLQVIIFRILNKFPIIYGDRRHLHYRLIDLGNSEKKACIIILTIYVFFSGISLLPFSKVIAFVYFFALIPLFMRKITLIKN